MSNVKDNDMQNLKGLGMLFSMGATLASGVIIGYFLGRWLDKFFGTSPWLSFIMLFAGMGAGFKAVYESMFPDGKGEE